ncbi:MAG TPA: bifunctional precorrin-2 dehydrogenase/sirohydrochlorin ferrochelatase [Chthonomonas sp.]|uniref:precorrin-2 dehydrogenase/sirohydrochlorin ferrochelatase family protein n=1 Tax=Chthonomonas sp. TaxID=2282153 RepID=UPI002B4B8140|nr:bifunctional precorrin-2 dehydrogenase/sirohydrochlorin ferrochelatase [Chthonomonas sp.]HLI49963.1 bifunctional precorrin-2 dehydrogenase/sirohydrochlorin ferrochelatase [Chthonomonas sp.]
MKPLYPIFLDISDRLCVVIGGGPVAERRVGGLLDAHARVRVVCLTATERLQQWAAMGRIELRMEPFQPVHLDDAMLVFAVTNEHTVNEEVARSAKERNLLVNVADAPEQGHFIVPSVVRRGDLCLCVATGGQQPKLTAQIADELAERYGTEYEKLLQLLGKLRSEILTATATDPQLRQEALERLHEQTPKLLAMIRAELDPEPEARAVLNQLLRPWLSQSSPKEGQR